MSALADTFNVPCPMCGVLEGRFCIGVEEQRGEPGTWAHPARWQAAEAVVPAECPRCRRQLPTEALIAHEDGCVCSLCCAACWAAWGDRGLCDDVARGQAESDAALLALARDLPPLALAEMVRVLRHGAAKYGAEGPSETGGEQTVDAHMQHAEWHLTDAQTSGGIDRDAETGALHLVHAACRLMLAAELVLRGLEAKEGGK